MVTRRDDTNLREETLQALAEQQRTSDDVHFVTDGVKWCTWEAFAAQAAKIDYYAGHDSQRVNRDLKVVGAGWWLERAEYDGAEWWEYKLPPTRPQQTGPLLIKGHYT